MIEAQNIFKYKIIVGQIDNLIQFDLFIFTFFLKKEGNKVVLKQNEGEYLNFLCFYEVFMLPTWQN